jgi:uncharacterized protein YjbJ (UPF0337 family)
MLNDAGKWVKPHYFSPVSRQMSISVHRVLHSFIMSALRPFIMANDELKGKGKQIEGQIREEVGKLTNNKTEQVKGKIQQIEGKVQQEIGKAKRKSS